MDTEFNGLNTKQSLTNWAWSRGKN